MGSDRIVFCNWVRNFTGEIAEPNPVRKFRWSWASGKPLAIVVAYPDGLRFVIWRPGTADSVGINQTLIRSKLQACLAGMRSFSPLN
jgi:hypothetical protein